MNYIKVLLAGTTLVLLFSCQESDQLKIEKPESSTISEAKLPELNLSSPLSDSNTLTVRTIIEWQAAIKKGFYARTNLDMKYEQRYQAEFTKFKLLAMRKDVTKTGREVQLNDLVNIKATALPYMAEWRNKERLNKNLSVYLSENKHKVLSSTPDELSLAIGDKEEYGIDQFSFEMLMRGDFNKDGFEDLVVEYSWESSGSHTEYGLMLFSRLNDNSIIASRVLGLN